MKSWKPRPPARFDNGGSGHRQCPQTSGSDLDALTLQMQEMMQSLQGMMGQLDQMARIFMSTNRRARRCNGYATDYGRNTSDQPGDGAADATYSSRPSGQPLAEELEASAPKFYRLIHALETY